MDKRITDKNALTLPGLAAVTSQCFTSGDPTGANGVTFFKVCISSHGNISIFESPAGKIHLQTREGYALCSNDESIVHGFDAGTAEQGWGEPAITQPNPGKLPLTIVRVSQDGMFRLTQTFTMDGPAREVIVVMTVKNLSAATISGMYLDRYFDGDLDGDAQGDHYDTASDGVLGRESVIDAGTGNFGLMLTQDASNFRSEAHPQTFGDWNPNGSGKQLARTCRGNLAFGPPSDFVGRLAVDLGAIRSGQSKVVTFRYKRI
jgi:hypothetical protein